jgi:hypothetical protein
MLKVASQIIYREMADYYRLQVELPGPVNKEHEWNLELLDENGRKRKEVDILYPREILPCSVQPVLR